MEKKKFKGSLFGYSKKDVNAYILEISQQFEDKKMQLEKSLSELEAKNKEISSRNAILEKERSYVADALLNAKQEAQELIAEAKVDAAKIKADAEGELETLKGDTERERAKIASIKAEAQKAISEYIEKLENIE